MAQALRVRREASTAEDAVHQPVLTKALGNLDRQEAPLKALTRLIHPLVPVDKGHKGPPHTSSATSSSVGKPTWPRAGRSPRRQVGTA
jgi:hypothetical protein